MPIFEYRGLSKEYMPSMCDIYEKAIVTSSTSKVFSSAGTRVGWIVTRDLSVKEAIMNCRSYNSICEGPINELIAAIILGIMREMVRGSPSPFVLYLTAE